MEVKKSPKADLERSKGLNTLMGFVVGLAIVFVGFEWSTRDVMVVKESDQGGNHETGEYASATTTTTSASRNRSVERR